MRTLSSGGNLRGCISDNLNCTPYGVRVWVREVYQVSWQNKFWHIRASMRATHDQFVFR